MKRLRVLLPVAALLCALPGCLESHVIEACAQACGVRGMARFNPSEGCVCVTTTADGGAP